MGKGVLFLASLGELLGIFEDAYDSTNRADDERILMAGIADFNLRKDIRELLYDLSGGEFWNPTYGKIWDAARELADDSRIITLPPFKTKLGDKEYGTLQSLTGVGARLVEVERAVEYVKSASQIRHALDGLKTVAAKAATTETYEDVLGAAHAVMDELDTGVVSSDATDIEQLVDQFWDEVENPPEAPDVIPTPWPNFNNALAGGGLGRGRLAVVAAGTGRGKSLVMLNQAVDAALGGYKVAVFSMEMPAKEVFDRLLSSTSGQKVSAIAKRKLSVDATDPEYWYSADYKQTHDTSLRLQNTVLRVWDDGDMSADWIRQQCQAMKRTVGLDLVIVDYLQIMDSDHATSREQTVSEDSRRLKKLAKALDVAVLTGSQMNELEDGSRPTTKSLRESRGIANNADLVFFVEHELVDGAPTGDADFVIAKQRAGGQGTVGVKFDGSRARFVE